MTFALNRLDTWPHLAVAALAAAIALLPVAAIPAGATILFPSYRRRVATTPSSALFRNWFFSLAAVSWLSVGFVFRSLRPSRIETLGGRMIWLDYFPRWWEAIVLIVLAFLPALLASVVAIRLRHLSKTPDFSVAKH